MTALIKFSACYNARFSYCNNKPSDFMCLFILAPAAHKGNCPKAALLAAAGH